MKTPLLLFIIAIIFTSCNDASEGIGTHTNTDTRVSYKGISFYGDRVSETVEFICIDGIEYLCFKEYKFVIKGDSCAQ